MWLSGVGAILAAVSALATIGCLITILGYNGKTKQHVAHIQVVKPITNGLDIRLKADDFSYNPGQFAFVGFGDKEKPHPFSIASAHQESGEARLLIKSSGDYTQTLKDKLKIGQEVTIEGPYGCFNFDDNCKQQVWIAAGIGIAPFLSAIESVGKSKQVTLFYSYREIDTELLDELKSRAIQAGVRLYLRDTSADGRFNQLEIVDSVIEPSRCSVWFCGPSKLGTELEKAFNHVNAFHRELFEFR
ncbi:putative oxidoreductase [Vibrio ishigakensis]|uniref:Putative oxidoreductase n=1 Tax=Vibrio ishigakensis TaxID=1481914 RepID=A0A0B8Q7A4_9VIBR|nr:putative oxidoreductase [Vibrio ishigakensis]